MTSSESIPILNEKGQMKMSSILLFALAIHARAQSNITLWTIAAVTGSIFRPYRNFNAAYSGTPNGGTLVLVAGAHPMTTAGNTGTWGSGQTKSITMRAPVGSVTIGN